MELANRGTLKHNSSVLSAKDGFLIVDRRPSKHERSSKDYLPCKHRLKILPEKKTYEDTQLGVH